MMYLRDRLTAHLICMILGSMYEVCTPYDTMISNPQSVLVPMRKDADDVDTLHDVIRDEQP